VTKKCEYKELEGDPTNKSIAAIVIVPIFRVKNGGPTIKK
jgi:hypothetical protein